MYARTWWVLPGQIKVSENIHEFKVEMIWWFQPYSNLFSFCISDISFCPGNIHRYRWQSQTLNLTSQVFVVRGWEGRPSDSEVTSMYLVLFCSYDLSIDRMQHYTSGTFRWTLHASQCMTGAVLFVLVAQCLQPESEESNDVSSLHKR